MFILMEPVKSAKKVTILVRMESVKNYHLIVHNVMKMMNAQNVNRVMYWMSMENVYLPIVPK